MSIQGKTVLLTGATTGIGHATAVELAKNGADLLITARNREKADATVAAIKQARADAKVEVLFADLSSMAEVRKLAAEYRSRRDRLDVLISNAGVVIMERRVTVDGFEHTFATNHLAPFLLTNLLLDMVKASAPSRIVVVASEAHRRGKINFDDLQREHGFSGFPAYCDSKLANILFTRELSRRLEGTRVTANCLHPGVVASGFGSTEGTGWLRYAVKLARPFMISPEKGARTTIYLASSPEVDTTTGLYFDKCKPKQPARRALDDETAKKLWDVSAKLVGLA